MRMLVIIFIVRKTLMKLILQKNKTEETLKTIQWSHIKKINLSPSQLIGDILLSSSVKWHVVRRWPFQDFESSIKTTSMYQDIFKCMRIWSFLRFYY